MPRDLCAHDGDRCRVYDLVNFASEMATHHATAKGQRALSAFLGRLVSDVFDLEGESEEETEFVAFFGPDPGGDTLKG